MSPENTKKLFDDFPELYRGKGWDVGLNLMRFGFECGDGWFDLIYALSQTIKQYALNRKLKGDDYPYATQVKEKFGGLRFYMGPMGETIEGAVGLAEKLSYKICERCGNPGSEKGSGWITILCNPCYEQKGNK